MNSQQIFEADSTHSLRFSFMNQITLLKFCSDESFFADNFVASIRFTSDLGL